jgi:hypothetical protein
MRRSLNAKSPAVAGLRTLLVPASLPAGGDAGRVGPTLQPGS